MIRSLKMVLELMRPEERRALILLIPLMIIASGSDIFTVVIGSAVLKLISDPNAALPGAEFLQSTLHIGGMSSNILLALLAFATIVLSNAATLFSIHHVNTFGFRQVVQFSEATLQALMRRDYEWFLHQSTSELKQQTLIETQRVVTLIVTITQIGARLMGAIGIVLFLFSQDPVLTTVLGVALCSFYGGLFFLIQRHVFRFGRQRSLADVQRHQIVIESLVGVKELKLHGLEHMALARIHEPNLSYARALTMVATIRATGKPALEVVGLSGLILMITAFQLTGRPLTGILSLVGTYALAAYRLLPVAQRIFSTAMSIEFERNALDNIYAQIKEPSPEINLEDFPPISFEKGVQLRGAGYQYPNTEQPVLYDIDLDIPKGSWIALVGSTGSGKSTLVDLLMGLLTPSTGSLEVDSCLIDSSGRIKRWQQHIGYVPQNLFMQDSTITNNIAFGEMEPDLKKVMQSAEMACIASFIEEELPAKYNTEIGERGMRVSGGQKQRLGIARALYRKPDLLVLDEATSALDNRTEARVMAALRKNFADTTVIMIAHRLSTTRHCDQIFILEQGRIIDHGSYDELLEKSKFFQQMVEASLEENTPATTTEPAPRDA